jgi:hypothetical protein
MAMVMGSAEPFATVDSALPKPHLTMLHPVAFLDKPDDVVNILLLGNDMEWAQGGRTDRWKDPKITKANRITKETTRAAAHHHQ